jgi:hypothetical protein
MAAVRPPRRRCRPKSSLTAAQQLRRRPSRPNARRVLTVRPARRWPMAPARAAQLKAARLKAAARPGAARLKAARLKAARSGASPGCRARQGHRRKRRRGAARARWPDRGLDATAPPRPRWAAWSRPSREPSQEVSARPQRPLTGSGVTAGGDVAGVVNYPQRRHHHAAPTRAPAIGSEWRAGANVAARCWRNSRRPRRSASSNGARRGTPRSGMVR